MGFIETEMDAVEREESKEVTCYNLNEIKENSKILIVMDYPSADNIKEGKAIAGSAMTILSMCMSSSKLILSSCSIIFVFPFSNEGKVMYKYFTEKGGFTTEGLPYLMTLVENIAKANPTVIVPIGEISLQAVTGKKGIEKWRGSILETTIYKNLKTIPTIHPRDSFKRFLLRYFISSDFGKIAKECLSASINLPKRELRINPTFSEVITYLDKILREKLPVASDIECPIPKAIKDKEKGETTIYGTKGVSCISFAISPFICMSIPFNNYVWTEEEEVEIWLRVAKIYEDPEIAVKWQNGAAFDIIYLFLIHRCLMQGRISDTLIKTNILYPEFPKSLAFLTSTRTDEPYYKDDGKEIKVDGTRDWDLYYQYNAKDSAVDFEIDISLDEELEEKNKEMWDYSEKLIYPLFYMQCRGVKVNAEKLSEHRTQAREHRDKLQKQLNSLVGRPINPGSQKQLITYFYEEKGFKKITKTVKDSETGERTDKVTVDTKALTKIARQYDCEEARLVKQIRGANKLISTYLEVPYDADGRLRCAFKQSTKFGRLASSKTPFKTGCNMQNLPKVFMEFLEADEDHMCFELDKKQAEWVDSANQFNDTNMLAAIASGADIHVSTAKLMFRAPIELIDRENELLGSLTEPTEIEYKRRTYLPEVFDYPILPNMSMRQAGKKCNHSFNYGLSANGFSNNYDMPSSVGKTCYNLYHSAYPGIKHAHDRIRNKIISDRTLINAFGWVRRFLGRLDDDTFRQGYSFYGQSDVGRLLNEGIISIYYSQYNPELRPIMYDIDLFNQVHDSVKGQYPDLDNRLMDFAKALKQMQVFLDIPLKANGREYTIKTDAKVGYNLKVMKDIPLYGTVEEIYETLKEIKKELKPKKKELPPIEESIESALIQEEEDEIYQRIHGKEFEL